MKIYKIYQAKSCHWNGIQTVQVLSGGGSVTLLTGVFLVLFRGAIERFIYKICINLVLDSREGFAFVCNWVPWLFCQPIGAQLLNFQPIETQQQ